MNDIVRVTFPDHRELLVRKLWNAFTTKYLVDVAIDWNGQMVRGHRLVLGLFLSPEKVELSDVAETDRLADLNVLLEFMYAGTVDIRRDQVEDVLRVAKKLEFQVMVDALVVATGNDDSDNSCLSARIRRRRLKPHRAIRRRSDGTTPLEDGSIDRSEPARSAPGTSKRHSKIFQLTKATTADNDCSTVDLVLEVQEAIRASLSDDCISNVDDPDHEANDPKDANCREDEEDPDYNPNNDSGDGEMSKSSKSTVSKGKKRRRADSNVMDVEEMTNYNSTHPMTKCKLCSFRSRSKKTHRLHTATEHSSNIPLFPCATCKKPFLDEDSLQQHRDHHSTKGGECSELNRCPHCEYTSRLKARLVIHLSRAHGVNDTEYFRCDCCSHVYLRREDRDRHRRRAHSLFRCKHCPFITEKEWLYTNHLFNVHRLSQAGKPVAKQQCLQCPYQAKNAAILRYHVVARHSAEKAFKCTYPDCSYAAGTKKGRDDHILKAHLDRKNFMCEICSYRTFYSACLTRHRLKHTGEKPFECPECKRRFAGKHMLKKHLRLHTDPNDKPFLCHLCSYASNRRDNLRTHLKGKHKDQVSKDDVGAL